MWTPLVLLAFAGIVFGQSPWNINQEYTYNINARTLTSLPDLKNQYVGVITKGKLVLQVESEDMIVGKLMNMVHAHFHDDIEQDWNLQSAEKNLDFQETNINNLSFVMKLQQGVVRSVSVDASLTNDQVNQLKAILSQLQIVKDEEYLIKRKFNQMPENTNNKPHGMYSVMEPTITGNCETVYDIEPVPSHSIENSYANWVLNKRSMQNQYQKSSNDNQHFQIVKTMNYSNCLLNRAYHYGISGDSDYSASTNRIGNFFTKSFVTKMLVKGNWNNFEIQNSYTTNRIGVSPTMYQNQHAEVLSEIQLTLAQTQPITQKLEKPSQMLNTGDLVYRRFNKPSDKDNRIVEEDKEQLQNYNNMMSRVRRSIENQQQTNENQIRSAKNQNYQRPQWYKSLSSSSEENVSMKQNSYYQPMPDMKHAPEIPLHHYTVGNQGRSIRYDNNINVEKEAIKLAMEISNDVQNQNEIPERNTLQKFDILYDLIRTMDLEQIQNIKQQLGRSNERDEPISQVLTRKIFCDAVAVAGTGPAVTAVLNWISEKQVEDSEAQNLLEDTMRNVRLPTEEMMRTIFEFLTNDQVVQQDKELYSVGILGFTDLLRRSHTDKRSAFNHYPVHVFQLRDQALENLVTEKVMPHLAERLQQSVEMKNGQQILLNLRAIGNLGHPDTVRIYENYLENNEKLTAFQRTALVLSMDRLVKLHPRLSSSVLFKIITNVADKPETRSVAVLLLMQANPTIVMLQRMAEMTHNDPSEAVQSIIKSAIESAAELKDPKYAELSNKAKNVKHLVNPKSFGYEHSKTYLRDYVAEEMNLIYKHQLSHIVGDDHIIPKGVIYQAFRNYGGLQMKTAEFQAMFSSVEKLLKLLPGNEYDNHNHNDRNNNNNFDQSKWSTHNIAEQLNIEPEVIKQLEGHILLKTFGRKKFFSFDEKTLKNLPKMLVSEYDLFKPQGQQLQFNKMYSRKQVVIAFPLATGYPFIYTFTMPTLLQAIGNVQMKTTPSIQQNPTWETIRSFEALNVTAKVHLVFSTDQIAKTGFITPFDRQRYVAGHVRKSYAHVPLNMKVDVDLKHGKISGKFTPIESNKNFNVIEGSSWPFTLRKDVFDLRPAAEAKDLKLILTHQKHGYRQTLGEKSTGMVFNINMEHHSSSNDRAQMSKTLWNQGIRSLASYPLSYKNLFKKISNNNGLSFWSFLPNSYQQPYYGNIGRNVIMSMASLPYMNELNMDEFIKMQGLLSLISLPFADVDSLEQSAQHSGVVKTGNLPWPRETLDQYFYNIQYDASRSANQIVKFSIDIDHVYNADKRFFMASKRVQGPSSSDEKKLAIPVNSEPDNEERRQQFLENAAHGIKQASSSVLDMSVVFDGNKRTEYVATISQAYSPVDEKERVLMFFSAKPVKPSAVQQIALTSTGKYSKNSMLNFEEALKNKDNSNVKAHMYIGENLQSNPTYVNIKADLEQTEEYRQHLVHENSDGRRCKQATTAGKNQIPACLNAIYWADFEDYVKISAEIENPNKEVQNIMREILRTVQQIGFWNLEEDRNVRTNPNHFETVLRISPHMNSVNLSIVTENKKYMLKDLDVDRSLWLFLSDENLHNRHQKNKREDRHICALDENVITTFDRNVFNNQIGKCWYAMLQTKTNQRDKSNTGPREVSVLVRESNNNPKQIDLMVVVAQKVGQDHVIQLQAGNSKVQVNGQERKLSSDQSVDVFDNDNNEETAVRVYQQVKGEYVVQLEENLMNIYYDGKRIRIHMDPRYRANTYGLCGTFTGEKFDDFITPKKCVMRNEKFFTTSWALTEEQSCSSEIKQIKDQAQNIPCDKIQYYSGEFVNKDETRTNKDETRANTRKSSRNTSNSSSSEENVECNLKQQIQFVENGDKICFTSDVLSACPSHCTAQRKEKQRVAVHCRNIHDSVAQLYKQQILSGANPDLSSRPVSKTLTFNVPTKCTYLK